MTVLTPAADQRQLRNAFACFPSGVAALCALVDGRPIGMAASSFTSVSLEPPLVSVCVRNASATWQQMKQSERLGLSFLGASQHLACRQLAAPMDDRFIGIDWKASDGGAVFIEGASVWFECSVAQKMAAGDHEIILLKIETLKIDPEVSPLVFYASRFRQLTAL
jgi:flavin reductase (DIM6/NTAB) family NADH-FMN oxidoreductase RutF